MVTRAIRIGELANQTALSVDAIRFYEKRELLPKPVRSVGRFRLYSSDDIERLRFIRQMHGLGFSLREIKELIDLRMHRIDACAAVREIIKQKLIGVRAKIHELQQLESVLTSDLRKCNQELRHRNRHEPCACPVLAETRTK